MTILDNFLYPPLHLFYFIYHTFNVTITDVSYTIYGHEKETEKKLIKINKMEEILSEDFLLDEREDVPQNDDLKQLLQDANTKVYIVYNV